MRTPVLQIVKQGMTPTLQHIGNQERIKEGISISGAMDTFAAKIANWFVGNNEHCYTLEIPFPTMTFVCVKDTYISITGAGAIVSIQGKIRGMWRPLKISRGEVITITSTGKNIYTYIAVQGGFTNTTNIKKGTILEAKPSPQELTTNIGLHTPPTYDNTRFPVLFRGNNLSNTAKIHDSSRMGYRIKWQQAMPKLPSIFSIPVQPGDIQQSSENDAIILMPDCQTTGGYPIIGRVLTTGLLSQCIPGTSISFYPVTLEKAKRLLFAQRDYERFLKGSIGKMLGKRDG